MKESVLLVGLETSVIFHRDGVTFVFSRLKRLKTPRVEDNSFMSTHVSPWWYRLDVADKCQEPDLHEYLSTGDSPVDHQPTRMSSLSPRSQSMRETRDEGSELLQEETYSNTVNL